MKTYIKAIACYLPDKVISNKDLAVEFPEWDIDRTYRKVGVLERHIAGERETAGDLAEKAARALFSENMISPSEIDFVLFCSQSPDYKLPSTACILQDRLGIPTSAGAFDFNLGCSGSVYGMGVAKGLITAGLASNVLLLTAETYSKYLHPSDKSDRAIFGDGAAACLLTRDKGFAEVGAFVFGTDGSGAGELILKSFGAKQPEKTDSEETDEDGHIRRDDYLYMNGSAVFNFTLDTVPVMMETLLQKEKLEKRDIDYFIFHQANKYMLETLRTVCGIEKTRFYINLEKTGNTVSPTILFGIKDARDCGLIKSGDSVMLCGFGVGLSYAGTVLYLI